MNDVLTEPANRARDRAPDVIVGASTMTTRLVLCPYLRDTSGEWRATTPTSAHRCTAVAPPAPVTPETQRTLCLVAEHVDCPLYRTAREAREAFLGATAASRSRRPIPMTAPLILERPTGAALLAARLRESLPQVGLAVLIALAAAAVVLARVIAP